jgi:tRNA1Val (adenine37-N6)-methyltransferase
MPNNYFRFKQFTVQQSVAAMKVNTDGVLLGAWTDVQSAARILDVGAGTGVIALMLAQRTTTALIDAVEIDNSSAMQAAKNIANSPWSERMRVFALSFSDYVAITDARYDVIVSNPPYFVDALLPHTEHRLLSRHARSLPYENLIAGANALLTDNGRFSLILPYAEANIFIAKAAGAGLYCTRKANVCSAQGKPVKRILMVVERKPAPVKEETVCIYLSHKDIKNKDVPDNYTPEYRALTKDFYLYF